MAPTATAAQAIRGGCSCRVARQPACRRRMTITTAAARAAPRGAAAPKKKTGVGAMWEFAADEKLLFRPLPADADAIQCIYAYPNEYTVGITSLGYQLVWAQMAASVSVHVARMFTDAHEPLPAHPDLVGFSLSWELDYANVLTQLETLGLPLLAAERGGGPGGRMHAIVFGGGPVLTANPEPYASFFDAVLLGDGEELLGEFLAAFHAAIRGLESQNSGLESRRADVLRAVARVPGVYVPEFYRPEYASVDGPLLRVLPTDAAAPAMVTKRTFRGEGLAASTVVSKRMAWEDIYMVEVVRSCPEMCRFCLASYLSLPFRSAPLTADGLSNPAVALIPALERGLCHTDRVGLLGASVTQHPQFDELLSWLAAPARAHVRLSIASVRAGTVTETLAATLAARGTKSLTVAVESGSERVRRIVNKKLTDAEIDAAAVAAQAGGLEALKLYGMVGVPGESPDDIEATVAMLARLRRLAPKLSLTLGVSTFVPKAHTPFAWHGVSREGEGRLRRLEKAARPLGIEVHAESYKWSVIQGLLSRGDRRLTALLLRVRGFGDSLGAFRRAFKELAGTLPPMDYYVHRDIPVPGPEGEAGPGAAEALPWGHIAGPLSEATLAKHAREAAAQMAAG